MAKDQTGLMISLSIIITQIKTPNADAFGVF
jgi:hypothetical protein